jgi:hypothetical protein
VIGPDFIELVIVAALVVVSCLITQFSSQRNLKRASAIARQQLELRLEGFTGAIAALEIRVAELAGTTAALSAATARPSKRAATILTNGSASRTKTNHAEEISDDEIFDEEIPTEILIIITAVVASYLGKKVRIRSARMLQSPYEIVNPWAQQGRATVQASHSLRSWSR